MKNLWKFYNNSYQVHITTSTTNLEKVNEKVVYENDLERRKDAYGLCGECMKPGTGFYWCQPCNAKRLKENFKNWTSGNKDIDELIQESQINALYHRKCLEWIPFENFDDVTYIAKGGFGKIYSANWNEGNIFSWDIRKQCWNRSSNIKVALKSLDDSSNISSDFINEIRSHISGQFVLIVSCFGITRDPKTKDYMMVLQYCEGGDLRKCLHKPRKNKIKDLSNIAISLLNIHNAGKVHKDLHSGNILCHKGRVLISDLGMCQPANQSNKKEGIYGVLPYMAPEVIRGREYTKAADIYSFGVIMNEFMSEEIPYNDILYDYTLAIKICKGLRPKISKDVPKLVEELINKCLCEKAEDRPTAKELYQTLSKWNLEMQDHNSEIYHQMKEYENNKDNKEETLINRSVNEIGFQTHPQTIYTNRLLNFNNLSETVNSDNIPTKSSNLISECWDCSLVESDLEG